MEQHVGERADRGNAVNKARRVHAAENIDERLRPRRIAELERETGQRQQHERNDNYDVRADVFAPKATNPLPAGGAPLFLELAAHDADERALQPEQVVYAEKCENPDQQADHEHPNDVDRIVVVRVGRIVVRIVGRKRLGDVLVTFAAGRHSIVRIDRRIGLHCRKIRVRRVTVAASRAVAHAKMHGLAMERVVEGLEILVVAPAALLLG